MDANKISCGIYQNPSIFGFSMGVLLAVGIFISYLPQHVKIIKRRSSEGLSPAFLLLGSLSAFAASVNIFLVTIPARRCCSSGLTIFQCANSLVGLIQIFGQTVGYVLIFFLCVFFTRNSLRESQTDYHRLTINFYIFISYVTLNVLFIVYLYYIRHSMGELSLFADISGIIATILSIIQYIPQIYTTFTIKHAGSLSIPMMLLQTPGGYIWSLSLYAQPGSKWSSWLPYFAAANLQLILLSMCLYFKCNYPTKLTEANAELRIAEENIAHSPNRFGDENTPLL